MFYLIARQSLNQQAVDNFFLQPAALVIVVKREIKLSSTKSARGEASYQTGLGNMSVQKINRNVQFDVWVFFFSCAL